ncbi:MAG: PD-(D/E)XK nuclease family protein [Alphaproteobacteria bacterium]|nr:PD-(D/E)XK nuclease family protein [Alphaproteobacteria bacterium]
MASNNNIFCVSNPSKIMDGLWQVITRSGVDLSDVLIFLPSRRAVRSAEKFIAEKMGGATILPRIVALGEGTEQDEESVVVVSELERVVAASYILSGLPSVRSISAALPIARALITMQDYLENSGLDIADIDWNSLVDEKFARHFKDKAEILSVLARVQSGVFNGRITETKNMNNVARRWCDYVKQMDATKSLVVVCGSTASVPVTRELMTVIAKLPNGRIILPGKISGNVSDFELDTNPYNSEYQFLRGLNLAPSDVHEIDVGKSHIDFMNAAFGNAASCGIKYDLQNCHLIECAREAEEAAAVAEIAARAVRQNKTVLVITPDAAGNQRLVSEFNRRGLEADFSGGTKGASLPAARALLNLLDDWIESGEKIFEEIYNRNNFNLFDTVAEIVEKYSDVCAPQFDITNSDSVQIWAQIKKLSDCLNAQQIKLNAPDARAFIADSLSSVTVRGVMDDAARVVVLGTIESRMQTADVVILTGLNEGMFPALGYENPWLPRAVATKIGLPSPNHKVSLMALDFMNLSCGAEVYWLRSKISGGVQTQESRFLSRVIVARGEYDTIVGDGVLHAVRARDAVEWNPLNYDAPRPPADWSDVYVTELELLIHNPYAFYVKHILRLRPMDDYWVGVDARNFGTLVHDVLQHATAADEAETLVAKMDAAARLVLGKNNLIFNFWHRRFVEIAPVAVQMLRATPNAKTEIGGAIQIAGRNVRARADRVWNGGVLDIKTGAAPSKSQLDEGTMPQLPLEAAMLQTGGFAMFGAVQFPVMQFLQLKSGDARLIEYNADEVANMMHAAQSKVTELFNMYSAGGAEYKYMKTGDSKYQAFDDFARATEGD